MMFSLFLITLEVMWFNFHTHSTYCDGKKPLAEVTDRAIRDGLFSLGLSSHAPLPFECAWSMKPERLQDYLEEIKQLKEIKSSLLFAGLEVDFVPQVIGPADFHNQLDYTIGSVHFVDSLPDGRRWEIDGLHSFFLEGLDKIFNGNVQLAFHRYQELTREMILTSCPEVVGHLDKIKIQNINQSLWSEEEVWYQNEILQTLECIKSSSALIEVNTRGIYQKKSETPYPSPWILKHIHQMDIPITLSSDAHHPDDLTNQFPEMAMLLQDIGFRQIHVLTHDGWEKFKFNETGIIT